MEQYFYSDNLVAIAAVKMSFILNYFTSVDKDTS